MDELDLTAVESNATYEEIRDYVLGHTGFKGVFWTCRSLQWNDEVAIGCKSVLTTLGKAMREDDITYMIMDMFDVVDKIYPCEFW